jgi:hypothetical protein
MVVDQLDLSAAILSRSARAASSARLLTPSSTIAPSPSASAISISSAVSASSRSMALVALIASSSRRRSRITSCAALGSSHKAGSSTMPFNSSSRRCARSQSRKRRSKAVAALISSIWACASARIVLSPVEPFRGHPPHEACAY